MTAVDARKRRGRACGGAVWNVICEAISNSVKGLTGTAGLGATVLYVPSASRGAIHMNAINKFTRLVGREWGYVMAGAAPSTGPQPGTAGALALRDLAGGLQLWRLWGLMGWQDIRQRYRRSVLGPFWLTLSMGVLVGTLGVLYGALFKIEVADYLPFLTLGFLAWGLIAGTINDGCTAFIESGNYIKQIKLPFSTFICRVVWRNLIIFAHNFVVYLVVAVVFAIWPGAAALLLLPGLGLIAANAMWVGLLFGMICARFRDVPPIVTSLLQVAFFLTPIIWKPELLGNRVAFVQINPFFHFVELVRAPLLGEVPTSLTWAVVLALTAGGWLVTFLFFRRFRSRIPYWL